jgi:bacillaene synthase trans-acting acyltransferase
MSTLNAEGAPETVFMFAGQGSQYYGMGREFYAAKPVFRDWMNFCSRRLEPRLGLSLTELLYRRRPNPLETFEATRFTHPAIFCLNFSMTQALIAEGLRPTRLLGYSLGELVAWCVAGVLRVEEALPLVCDMADRIETRTPPGAMLAILGSPELARTRPDLFAAVTVACLNYEQNFVISGTPEAVRGVQGALRDLDVPCQLLPITRGFHSPLLNPIEAEFKAALAGVALRPPETPVISCLLAGEVQTTDLTAAHCWDVVRSPVRFADTIRSLEAQGGPYHYVDVGPSGTLASFVRTLLGPAALSRASAVLTAFGHDLSNLEKLLGAVGRPAVVRP